MTLDQDDRILDRLIEIIPPDHDILSPEEAKTCLCCERLRPASCMDEDGCGICEECLSP